ncbi:MAG: TonB-dependent receptor [Gammaproteobacteria bacterium]|nr:TonB-dependent receptor [Gammaproteobacteria bacterium]
MSKQKKTLPTLAGTALITLITLTGTAWADTVLEEVVVTAQKREQSAQDVPLAMSTLTGSQLDRTALVEDIDAIVPSVQMSTSIGGLNAYIRGIGSSPIGAGADPSVAVHADGMYISRQGAQVAALYDVQRVEVVRGPQGTLYGRNATGGSLNIVANKPTEELEGYARVGYGNYDAVQADAAIGGPISDAVRGRLSFTSRQRDGFGINLANGEDIDDLDEVGVRGQLEFDLAENVSLHLLFDHFKGEDDSYGWHYFGAATPRPLTAIVLGSGGIPSDVRDVDAIQHPGRSNEVDRAVATLDWEINDSLAFKSITGYADFSGDLFTDISSGVPPGPPTPQFLGAVLRERETDWLSQELQLTWTTDRAVMLFGAYNYTEDISNVTDVPIPVLPLLGATGLGIIPVPFPADSALVQSGEGDIEAWALFANLDYEFTESLTATIGLRYSYEERSREGFSQLPTPFANTVIPALGEEDWDDWSPRFALNYTVSDDVMIYGSVSRGFKSGVLLVGSTNPVVDPETVTSYEVGLKSELFDRRAQLNVAAFYSDFSDLQTSRVAGNTTIIENSSDAEILGIEVDSIFVLTENLRVDMQFSWLDTEYDGYMTADPVRPLLGVIDLSGNQLAHAPELSTHIGIEQGIPFSSGAEVTLRLDWSWQDDEYFDPFNQEYTYQEAYHYLGAEARWVSPTGNWDVSVWGKNLTDEDVHSASVVSSDFLGYPRLGVLNPPATYGIDVRYSF